MIDTFTAEVYSGGVWNPTDLLSLTIEESLQWGKPTNAKFVLDNFNGNMRALCAVANRIRVKRNGTQIYYGIINRPKTNIGMEGYTLNLDTNDYYVDRLLSTQTGDSYLWNFSEIIPSDLFKCFIGTKYILQELFAHTRRIDEDLMSNVCILDQTLQLVKNGSTYQASGSLTSKTIQNSSDDDDAMGDISAIEATIVGDNGTTGDIALEVSRNDGTNYTDIPLTYDGTQWTGSILAFVDGLIDNGDCELALPTLNSVSSDVLCTATLDTAQYYNGVKSLKLTSGASPSGFAYILGDNSTVTLNNMTPGQEYTFSVWAYVPTVSGIDLSDVCLYIAENNGATWEISASNSPTEFDEWQQLTVTKTLRADAILCYICVIVLDSPANASIYVDDLALDGPDVAINELKYRVTLTAGTGNATTPTITSIRLDATTVSDTGVGEGTIEAWTNPVSELNPNDTITQDFGGLSRYTAIANLIKITGQDAYIDSEGDFHVLNHRGIVTPAHEWNTDTNGGNLSNFTYELIRDTMANVLTVVGNGQISNDVNLNVRWTMKDAASITAYERIHKIHEEKAIKDLSIVAARCYVLLQQWKNPAEKLNGTLIDGATTDWSLGDTCHITDSTYSTGVSATTGYRITKVIRKYDSSGEETSLEFCNVRTSLEETMATFVDYVMSALGTEQATKISAPVSYPCWLDKNTPGEIPVIIDPHRTVARIILTAFSRQFDSTSKSVTVSSGGGSTSGSGGGQTSSSESGHNHVVELGMHYHSLVVGNGVSGDAVYFTGTALKSDGATGWVNTTNSDLGGPTSQGGSAHSHTVSDHTHSTPDHTHSSTMVFGIYKFGYYAPVQLRVNSPTGTPVAMWGTHGDESSAFTVALMDITSLYSSVGGANKLGNGLGWLYFTSASTGVNNPDGLVKVFANVQVIYQ